MTDKWSILKKMFEKRAFSPETAISLLELYSDPALLKDLLSPIALPHLNRVNGKYYMNKTSADAFQRMRLMAKLDLTTNSAE